MGYGFALLEIPTGRARSEDFRNAYAWFWQQRGGEAVAVWETCLRALFVVPEAYARTLPDPPAAHFSGAPLFLRGESAYRHLLGVVCGLDSPIVGETQVMGQFKDFLAQVADGPDLRPSLEAVLADAKAVRRKWLGDVTHGSYGSQARRVLKPFREIAIVGSGKLAREIAEWTTGEASIRIYARRPETARAAFASLAPVRALAELGADLRAGAALVLAAPLKVADLRHRLEGAAEVGFVLDLREESKTDPLRLAGANGGWCPGLSLREFFAGVEHRSRATEAKVDGARAEIERLARVRRDRVVYRPFGWEDVCA